MARSHINSALICLGACILMSLAPQARADIITIDIFQNGSDVDATVSGSLSVSGSVDSGTATIVGVEGDDAYLVLGSGQNEEYTGVTGPSSFGTGGEETPTSTTGGQVGFGLTFNSYLVPFGYVAGSPLTTTATWSGATLSSLGLTPGTYDYTLGSGDTVVVDIGPTVPEPATSGLLLTGAGLLGFMAVLRKRKSQSQLF